MPEKVLISPTFLKNPAMTPCFLNMYGFIIKIKMITSTGALYKYDRFHWQILGTDVARPSIHLPVAVSNAEVNKARNTKRRNERNVTFNTTPLLNTTAELFWISAQNSPSNNWRGKNLSDIETDLIWKY